MSTPGATPEPVDYLADGTPVDHDPFSCECHETCSYCTGVWPIARLRRDPDPSGWGEQVCPPCRTESKEALR